MKKGYFDVTDFGAKCDGQADDAPAFQRAIAALRYGGTIQIPPGICFIAHNIVVDKDNTGFQGSGLGATVLMPGPEVDRLFDVHPIKAGTQLVFPAFRNFSVQGSKAKRATAFYFRSVRYVFIDHIFTTGCFISYWIDRSHPSEASFTSTFHLSDFQIDDTPDALGARGILINGAGDDWFISKGRIFQNSQAKLNVGIELRNGAGFMIDAVDISSLGTAFLVDPLRGDVVRFGQISALQCDTSWKDGAVLDGSEAFASGYPNGIYNLHFLNSWFSSSGVAGGDGNGLHIVAAKGITVEASQVYSNSLNGILLERGAEDIHLLNNQISGNSNGFGNNNRTKGKYSGIFVADGARAFSIIGNQIGQQTYYDNSQQFGIRIGKQAKSYRVLGNDLTNNMVSSYVNDSAGETQIVEVVSDLGGKSNLSNSLSSQPSALSEIRMIPRKYAELSQLPDGTIVYCRDCAPEQSCRPQGRGSFARKESGKWLCR